MKIIAFYQNEGLLIKRARKGERQAQRAIYEKYAPKMLSICRQYIKDVHFAEDVMVSAFVKVFAKLEAYAAKGSFEGWVRRIMVHESISYLRKKQFVVYDEAVLERKAEIITNEPSWGVEHIQQLIDELPEGYRTVFLLYCIEGYKHHEIAELLEISEGTSKSQLFKARKMLQENLRLDKMEAPSKDRSEKRG